VGKGGPASSKHVGMLKVVSHKSSVAIDGVNGEKRRLVGRSKARAMKGK